MVLRRRMRTATNIIFSLPWSLPGETLVLKMSSTSWNISPEWILIISYRYSKKQSTFFTPYLLGYTEIDSCLNSNMQQTKFYKFMLRGACRVYQVVRKVQNNYSFLHNTYFGLETHYNPISSQYFGDFLQSVPLLNCYLKESIWVDPITCLGNCNTWFVFIFFVVIVSPANHVFNWLKKSFQTRLWMTN